jgi:hypothetical protein
MKNFSVVGSFLMGSLFTLCLASEFSFTEKIKENRGKAGNKIAQWNVPALPEQISFANERAPVQRWDVKEKFDKEFLQLYYSPGAIIYLIKLANRNFPIISERLKANGVPDDFKYLCIAESNMQSWAVSSSGAVGFWQFLNGTGKGFGLEISSEVDQRQDLEKATDAACKYFKTAYAKFGNWTAAAASYNCGMGGYNAQAAFQRTNNYYDLQLPEETNKYVLRILCFKYLIENAEQLGFNVEDDDRYQPLATKTITVTSSIPDLAQFAISNGTTYKILKVLNPWIKGKSLTVSSGKPYELILPAN